MVVSVGVKRVGSYFKGSTFSDPGPMQRGPGSFLYISNARRMHTTAFLGLQQAVYEGKVRLLHGTIDQIF